LVDEDKTIPHGNLGFGQREVRGIYFWEIPSTRKILEGTVNIPAEAVEWAAQFTYPATFLAQCPTTVQAHVVERLNAAVGLAHNDEFVVNDVIGDVIASVGDVILAADKLPYLTPHFVDFTIMEFARDIPINVHGGSPEILIDVISKCRWDRT
jgi:hypothetical protein